MQLLQKYYINVIGPTNSSMKLLIVHKKHEINKLYLFYWNLFKSKFTEIFVVSFFKLFRFYRLC